MPFCPLTTPRNTISRIARQRLPVEQAAGCCPVAVDLTTGLINGSRRPLAVADLAAATSGFAAAVLCVPFCELAAVPIAGDAGLAAAVFDGANGDLALAFCDEPAAGLVATTWDGGAADCAAATASRPNRTNALLMIFILFPLRLSYFFAR